MITTFSRFKIDKETQEKVLLALVKDFLPSPEPRALVTDDIGKSNIKNEVIKEIRRRLKLDDNDYSESARAQILDFISEEIGNYVSVPILSDSVKSRLGDLGYLRPEQYQIKFGDGMDDTLSKFGLRRANVRQVLEHPDQVEHLSPPDSFDIDKDGEISLYAKHYGDLGALDRHTLLVQTRRKQYTVEVYSVWIVYHSDVELSSESTPVAILEKFAQKYGIDFSIGNSPPKKFYSYQSVSREPGHDTTLFTISNKPAKTLGEMIIRAKSPRLLEVRAAFHIDVVKYVADLQKHGITATA